MSGRNKRHAMSQYSLVPGACTGDEPRANTTYECMLMLVTMPILPRGRNIRLTMKHSCGAAESDASSPSKKPKRHQVSLSMFTKWQLEQEHQTMSWLRCDMDKSDSTVVDTLCCHTCRTSEAKIIGMKNYSRVWSSGSTNHKTSCVVDHANSDQHKAAMKHTRKAYGIPITEYSPIARGILN